MRIRLRPASCGILSRRLLPAFLPLALLPALLRGADGSAAAGGGPDKPYTLFMGANLTVEWQGKLWPVRGVQRNAFVIEADGQKILVRDTELRMKIDTELKMTASFAAIADEKAERAYTPANDPRHFAHDTMMAASEGADALDISSYNLNNLQSVAGRDAAGGHPSMVGPQMLAAAGDSFQRNLADQGAVRYSVSSAISREQDELARQLFDAFSLSFKISAGEPLENPYLVLMVRFRDKPDDRKPMRLLIYAQNLPVIDRRPQAVHLFRGGFPRGYQLVNFQIHLYNEGREIATSAASNQVGMTKDEAFQYSVVNYVIRNRDRSLPPAPAATFWPRDLSDRLPASELNRPLYLKVD